MLTKNMTPTNRNRDFCTYGLYLVERLRFYLELHQHDNPDHHLWMPSAYELLRADYLPDSRYDSFHCFDLQSIFTDQLLSLPFQQLAASIKAVAALLRYAHLGRIHVSSVRCCTSESLSSELSTNAVIVVAETVGGGHLRLVSVDRPRGGNVVLQGGDPDVWFNTERWASLEGIIPAGDDPCPLSTPLQFAPAHRPTLVSVGARPSEPTWWLPPPGSANDDLAEYVLRYSCLRDCAFSVPLH